ncbi:MAG: ROK family protein [Planctomycetia bacterium]|jgi:glucokinase
MSRLKAERIIDRNDSHPPYFVGVDLGGTNIKLGVVDDRGQPLSCLNIPTERERGPQDAMERTAKAIDQVIAEAGLDKDHIAWVGIGTPGTMDVRAGIIITPTNLVGWEKFPICEHLSELIELPVTLANDASAATYGEYWVGSGRSFNSLILLTLGTGIGGGIIIGGLAVNGENGSGAECGHITIDASEGARMCGCGQPGHLEAYASATAVIRRTHEAIEVGTDTMLHAKLDAGEELTPKLVAETADEGDELCIHIIDETARYLGIGITSLLHTVDPNGVLLGGAMTFGGNQSPLGRRFLTLIRREVRNRALAPLPDRVVIDFASLGSDAGFIGAAGIARWEYGKGA